MIPARVIRSSRCVAKLVPGEVKRIPRNETHPVVGFYMACPSCGKVDAFPGSKVGGEHAYVEEVAPDGSTLLTATPSLTCARCRGRTTITKDAIGFAHA